MRPPLDLEVELSGLSLSPDHFAALAQVGVPIDLLRIRNWCRSARVIVEGPLWFPDPAGSLAVIVPVRGANHLSDDPAAALWCGQVHDVVAFDPRRPNRWACRTGAAPVLGVVLDPLIDPTPVPIWRTPLGWLQNDGRGLCLLGPDLRERQRVLLSLSAIRPEDARHGAELQALARWPFDGPSIEVVPSVEVAHVAA